MVDKFLLLWVVISLIYSYPTSLEYVVSGIVHFLLFLTISTL